MVKQIIIVLLCFIVGTIWTSNLAFAISIAPFLNPSVVTSFLFMEHKKDSDEHYATSFPMLHSNQVRYIFSYATLLTKFGMSQRNRSHLQSIIVLRKLVIDWLARTFLQICHMNAVSIIGIGLCRCDHTYKLFFRTNNLLLSLFK